MDIKELKKLIVEEANRVKQEKEKLSEAPQKARYSKQKYEDKQLFNDDALDIIYNFLISKDNPPEVEQMLSSLTPKLTDYHQNALNLGDYFKKINDKLKYDKRQLEIEAHNEKRNHILYSKMIDRKLRKDLKDKPEEKRQLLSKLKDPNLRGAIEAILYAMGVDSDSIYDFERYMGELIRQQPAPIKSQPGTNPGTPRAKLKKEPEEPPVDPSATTLPPRKR